MIQGMKRIFLRFISVLTFFQIIPFVRAHCPLCTAGAAAAAGAAAVFGVKHAAIGIFLGAFAVSMGLWIGRKLPKKIPFQTSLLVFFSFVSTILPLLPFLKDLRPIAVFWFGNYGSLFNRTYLVDFFLVASIIGGIIVLISPWLSKQLTQWQKRHIPYQGIMLTFLLLFLGSLLFQFW